MKIFHRNPIYLLLGVFTSQAILYFFYEIINYSLAFGLIVGILVGCIKQNPET